MDVNRGRVLRFLDVLRKMIIDTVESTKPVNIMYGVVKSIDPIKIYINAKFIIPGDCLVVPEYLSEKTYWTEGEIPARITVPSPIQLGSKVVILREQQGQKFLLLGVVA